MDREDIIVPLILYRWQGQPCPKDAFLVVLFAPDAPDLGYGDDV